MVQGGGVADANAPCGPLIHDGPRPGASLVRIPGSHGRVCELWSCKLHLLDAPAQRDGQLPGVEGVDAHAATKVAPAVHELCWRRQLQRDALVLLGIMAVHPAHLVVARPEVSHRRGVALSGIGVSMVGTVKAGLIGRQSRPELGQRELLRAGQRRCRSC